MHCLGPSILVTRLFLAFLFIKINRLSLKDLLLVFSKSRALRAPFLTKMLNLFFSIAPGKCHKNIWIKVFKNGPSKIFGRKPLKNLSDIVRLRRPYQFKFFKCSLRQILLHPFSNILTNLFAKKKKKKISTQRKDSANNIAVAIFKWIPVFQTVQTLVLKKPITDIWL